jgi:hypothetical protein
MRGISFFVSVYSIVYWASVQSVRRKEFLIGTVWSSVDCMSIDFQESLDWLSINFWPNSFRRTLWPDAQYHYWFRIRTLTTNRPAQPLKYLKWIRESSCLTLGYHNRYRKHTRISRDCRHQAQLMITLLCRISNRKLKCEPAAPSILNRIPEMQRS